jgi:hypothetical protein
MTSEQLVTIDFDSDIVNNSHDEEIVAKNSKSYQKNNIYLNEETEVIFSECNSSSLEDIERIANESQPLLGGGCDQHDTHQIIYNQFPSKSIFRLLITHF